MPIKSDVISLSPSQRTFSDKVVQHSSKMSFALNVILAVGLLTSFFTGGVSLIVAASIYGALVLATNGPFQLAIRNMRNSNTEMKLAWQAANEGGYFGKSLTFQVFKQWYDEEGSEDEVNSIMYDHFWSVDEETQLKIRNAAGVNEADYATYLNSSNAIDNLKTKDWLSGKETCRFEMIEENFKKGEEVRKEWRLWLRELANSENPDDTLKKIREWLEQIGPQESHMYLELLKKLKTAEGLELLKELKTAERQEAERKAKVIIAWQMWLQDPSRPATEGKTLNSFEQSLDRKDPQERQARLKQYMSDFWRKSRAEQEKIASAAGVSLPADANTRPKDQKSAFETEFLDKMFPSK